MFELLDAFHWTQLLQPQFYVENGDYGCCYLLFCRDGIICWVFPPGDSLLFVAGIYAHEITQKQVKWFPAWLTSFSILLEWDISEMNG